MPCYEHECETHGRFEVIVLRYSDDDYRACPVCDVPAPIVPSLPVMRPDTLWAGEKNQYGYFTSAGKLKAEMKRRNHVTVGDRTDREGMDKIAERAAEAREENNKKRIRGVMERAFGPSGLGLGGADGEKLMKEAK